ncbi:MAG: hypothetical protein IJT23_06475, partial [Clostridia bacterium]|nr:hypothetical protein [Clostridia bacterium]
FTVDVTDYILSIPEDGIATLKIQNTASDAPVIVLQSSESAISDEAKPKLIAERTYTDDYSGGLTPTIYINGKMANSISEGVAAARVAFIGDSQTPQKGTLALALYNGGRFEKVALTSMDFSKELVNDMSVSLNVPSGSGYALRAFIWDDLYNIEPLADVVAKPE